MKLKEKLKEKKDALIALKEKIEAGDEEAITKASELTEEIESLEETIKAAEKAKEKLEMIGKEEKPEEKGEKKTGLKALDLSWLEKNRGTIGANVNLKTYSDPETIGDNKIYDYDKNPVNLMPALNARGLFGAETISGNALTYYVISDAEGLSAVDGTAEGVAKDRIHIPYTPKTAALTKIAAYFKESDELIHDAPFLESAIRNRGVYEFQKAIESYLVSTLAGTTGVQVSGTAVNFDTILQAKQEIIADTGYIPDAMLINPSDWATLLQKKDNNQQYMLGGPGFGSYGNGNYFENPKVWGLNVVQSAAVTEGAPIVGAFKPAASVVTQAGNGQRVEVSNSDQDDFIKNMITVRIEERLVLAVRVPAAFCIVGGDESSS